MLAGKKASTHAFKRPSIETFMQENKYELAETHRQPNIVKGQQRQHLQGNANLLHTAERE